MKMTDVTTVVQKAVAQAMGETYMSQTGDIAALESDKLVDVGTDVANAGSTETVFKNMITQLAILEIENRAYSGDLKAFMVRDTEWGGFVERVCFGLAQIVADPMWNIYEQNHSGGSYSAHDYSTAEHQFYPASVSTKVFVEGKAIMTPISRTVDQLKEAFKSWEQMNSFLSGVAQVVRNTIEEGICSMRHMLAQNAIAFTTGDGAGVGSAVHLLDLTDAMGLTTSSTTAEAAMKDADVVTFILQTIAETRDNMKLMSSAFNDGTVPTFTPTEDSRLILINKFDKAAKFLVKANTFNKEDLAIGEYETTTAWQGFASTDVSTNKHRFDLADVTKVAIDPTVSSGSTKLGTLDLDNDGNFIHNYCIGLLFDYKALGICPYKRKVTGSYTAVGDFFNEFHHTLMNLLLDSRYNMVTFWLDRATDWT